MGALALGAARITGAMASGGAMGSKKCHYNHHYRFYEDIGLSADLLG